MNYVIIGNSAAAIGCVEGIRRRDPSGQITIISDEPHHTYSRPLISYLLLGKTDEQRMKYRNDDFYEKNKVKAILGKAVKSIDPKQKTVTLDDETISYDKLLVATGSRPFVPPMKGLEQVENQFTFMTLDSAKALDEAIDKDSRVLIIGAGLIGLKCAEGIQNKVKSITVVDLADRILPSILDQRGSEIVQKHIESKGVSFILNASVSEFEDGKAKLSNGKAIPFDVLVLAVGVRPNTELIESIGGKVDRGIIIDEHCKISVEDIYAAGDCTISHDISSDQNKILALLPNAYMQGEVAGCNMAGGNADYNNAIPMNAIGFFGLHIITAGTYDGEEWISPQTSDPNDYKKLVSADNRLKGYILIGNVKRAGIYTALIREQTPLDTIDYELIKESPQLMAYSSKVRTQVLGGANK